MIELIFIRHGATAGNLEKRYIGSTDEALCDAGIAQVEMLKKHGFQADFLFISPMLRARQTAGLLFPELSGTIVEDFRELDFGLFEGKTSAELASSSEYRAWVESLCLNPIPQGESISGFKTRCCSAFEIIMQGLPDNCRAAFVVHGGVIMSIMEAYAQPKKGFYDYHIGNGKYLLCMYDSIAHVIKPSCERTDSAPNI